MLRRREDEIPRLNLTVRAAVGRQEIEKIGKVDAPPGQRAAAHYDRRIGQHAPDRGTEARQQRPLRGDIGFVVPTAAQRNALTMNALLN